MLGFVLLMLCYIPIRAVTGLTPSPRQTATVLSVFVLATGVLWVYSGLFAIVYPRVALEREFFRPGIGVSVGVYKLVRPRTERGMRLYAGVQTLFAVLFFGFWLVALVTFAVTGGGSSA